MPAMGTWSDSFLERRLRQQGCAACHSSPFGSHRNINTTLVGSDLIMRSRSAAQGHSVLNSKAHLGRGSQLECLPWSVAGKCHLLNQGPFKTARSGGAYG